MAIFEVTDYGAVAGTADSTSAFQSTINTAGSAAILTGQEQTVKVPEDEFSIKTRTGTGGLYWCLDLSYDNLVFENHGNVICDPTAGAAVLFYLSGAAKAARTYTGSINTWTDYWYWHLTDWATLYDLDSAGSFEKGTNELVLDTAGDAANIRSDDWIVLGTGHCLSSGFNEPDSEFLRVSSANPANGVITLAEPLKTTYEQEYFIAGTTGYTSTSVTANPAKFAVGVMSDRLLFNTTIRGGTYEQRSADGLYNGNQTVDFTTENIFARCKESGLERFGRSRGHRVQNCQVAIYDTVYNWWLSVDSTCTDTNWIDCTLIADQPTPLHIHEGAARTTATGIKIHTPTISGDYHLLSCRARGYDTKIDNCLFIGGGDTSTIYVDVDYPGAGVCSGRVTNCEFVNPSSTPFAISEPYPALSDWEYDGRTASLSFGPVTQPRVHEADHAQ